VSKQQRHNLPRFITGHVLAENRRTDAERVRELMIPSPVLGKGEKWKLL
jgi:hypothetical protein